MASWAWLPGRIQLPHPDGCPQEAALNDSSQIITLPIPWAKENLAVLNQPEIPMRGEWAGEKIFARAIASQGASAANR